jgi:tryptophan 2,3-dioxygenase
MQVTDEGAGRHISEQKEDSGKLIMALLQHNVRPVDYLLGNQDKILNRIDNQQSEHDQRRAESAMEREIKQDLVVTTYSGWEK